MNLKILQAKQRHSLYIILGSLICFVLLGVVSYIQVGDMMIDQSKDNAMGLSVIAAGEIDGDKFATIRSEQDRAYQEVYELLSKYRDYNMLQYIYTMRREDGVLTFVVDEDPEDPAACGEEYEWLEDMAPAFEGQVCCDQTLSKDKWGEFFSAYAPIFDSERNVVGIVGCDIMTSDIKSRLAKLRTLIIILISIFALISLIFLSVVSRRMMGQDYLTGIASYDKLKSIAAWLKRHDRLQKYTGIQINIKDFDYINQQVGYNKGDEILREYAQYLQQILNRQEYVARNGNDNFILLIFQSREQEIIEKLSSVRLEISTEGRKQEMIIHSRGGIYPIREGDDISRVVNMCALAVDSTREMDAEDFVWYQDGMTEQMVAEKKVLAEYEGAMERGEFQVFYQPKVNIQNNRLCGAEALIRWIQDGKIIPPNEFIPVLEKDGKIIDLDFFVFEQVCKDLRKWMDEGISPVRISSNFSKLHLKNPRLSQDVLTLIDRYKIDTDYVEVELTESSGYSDFESLEKFVKDMEHAGIYTSIDDFGTGYSSLSMLKDIDVDVVKLDKSFFDNLKDGEEHSASLVGNVIRMIKDLDRTVICEGVETQSQIEFLKGTDCKIVQGYLYDKPLPRQEFEKRLREPEYQK